MALDPTASLRGLGFRSSGRSIRCHCASVGRRGRSGSLGPPSADVLLSMGASMLALLKVPLWVLFLLSGVVQQVLHLTFAGSLTP
jgi:hypothetical protein